MSTPYAILGVAPDTPIEDCKKAYRKLCAQHHPDNGGDKDTFDRINKAWQQIQDGDFVMPIEETYLKHKGLFDFVVS